MILHVDAGGRTRAVEVRRDNGRFIVALDGREHAVDVHEISGNWSLIVAKPSQEGLGGADSRHEPAGPMRSYEVSFAKGPGGAMMVHVNGQPVHVRIAPPNSQWGARGRVATPDASGPQRVAAPMPGKIVKVLVKPGDRVAARQGLVVVEAMKMENELRAPGPGIVSEVLVTEGSSVDAGAILVVVE